MTEETKEDAAASEQASENFLDVKGLSLRTSVGVVYDDVSLSVKQGQLCCVFGDNGSGKTSLLLSVCGRMKFAKGQGTLAGYDLRKQFRRARRISAISFIPGINDVQPFLAVKNIVAAELSLSGTRGNKANTDAFLEEWGFLDKKEVKFNKLDSYDSARLGIVLAMAAKPQLLVVDDIQNDLTQHQSIKLVAFLRDICTKYGTTVLFACSEYEVARYADGIVVMSEGAEAQRRAVLREEGRSESDAVAVFGTGNGVNIDMTRPEGSFMRRPKI